MKKRRWKKDKNTPESIGKDVGKTIGKSAMNMHSKIIRTAAMLLAVILFAACFFPPLAYAAETSEAPSEIILTTEEKDYIKAHPVVMIAMDVSWVPYAYNNSKEDSVNGIIPNILDIIANRVGLTVEYVPKDSYMEALNSVSAGETMLVSGVADDTAMADRNNVLITDSYININYAAVTRHKINDLYTEGSDYRMAVCAGSYATIAMQEKMPTYEFVEYRSNEECMNSVEAGETDIALIATHTAEYYSRKHEFRGLKTVILNDFSWGLCFGVNKNTNSCLIDILNKGIASFDENDTDQAIYRGLIDASLANSRIWDWVYDRPLLAICVSGIIVALILVIIFQVILQHHKISELKKRKHIQEDRDKMLILLNSIPGGVGIFEIADGKLTQIYMNDGYYRLIGDEREKRNAGTDNYFLKGVYQKDRKVIDDMVEEILSGKNLAEHDYRAVRGDGGYAWIHVAVQVGDRSENRVILYCSFSTIDEMVAARKALEENSAILEAAMKSAHMSVWEYDKQQGVVVQRQNSIRGFNFGDRIEDFPEQMIRRGCIHKDSTESYRRFFMESGEENKTTYGDFLVCNPGEKNYWWERIILTPVFDKTGAHVRSIGTSLNVTGKKEQEERYLHQLTAMDEADEENLLEKGRYNLSKNTVLYCVERKDGKEICKSLKTYDDAAEAFVDTGISKEKREEIRRELSRDNLLREFSCGNFKGMFELKRMMPDGSSIWSAVEYSLFEEPNTGDVIAFTYVYDITERILESQIAAKLSSIGYEAVGLLDTNTHQYMLRTVRSKIEGPYAIGSGDFDERAVSRLSVICLPSERDFLLREFKTERIIEHLKEQEVYYLTYAVMVDEKQIRRKKCQFCYLDQTHTTILYCRSDITDMYQREQEQLKRTEEALEEAKAANSAKTEFFSRMSHDMRTPMNGILGLASLSVGEENPVILQENIEKIKQSGEYLLGLINDTLDFQKIESGGMQMEPQIVSSQEVVDMVFEMMEPAAESKGVKLQVVNKNADFSWYVRVDPMRIKQIFVNLLSNAVKFTPAGGRIEFEFECIGREGMISHSLISVRDTGIGMSPEFMKNGIFKPFSQENNEFSMQYAGTGLGLSIVKKLVEMMGGRVEAESEPGVGSVFRLYLDFERVDSKYVTKTVHADKQRQMEIKDMLRGRKILLVEDHPLNAEIAAKLLTNAGCQVVWAKNGAEGVKCFEESAQDSFDMILMDIRMPVMDGLHAAKAIRSLSRKDAALIPIIAMTANAYEDDVKLSLAAGMNGHLSKPLDPQLMYESMAKNMKSRKER
jgi:signal transduction histidine kinase/CheY-like chemotaxis protein/ABC-type amino acid transport substrate-binding protein